MGRINWGLRGGTDVVRFSVLSFSGQESQYPSRPNSKLSRMARAGGQSPARLALLQIQIIMTIDSYPSVLEKIVVVGIPSFLTQLVDMKNYAHSLAT